MRTDDYGHEIAPPSGRRSIFGGSRLFTLGLALGVGLCVGMGPPLPLIDKALSAAKASEGQAQTLPALPRQWLVLRNALLDPSVTGVAYSEQQADMDLLHGKWLALRDALQSAWAE